MIVPHYPWGQPMLATIDSVAQTQRIPDGPLSAISLYAQNSEIRKLTTLLEISQTLASTLDFKAALPRILKSLERHQSIVDVTITLVREASDELYVAAANNSESEGKGVQNLVGGQIVRHVIRSGQPIIIPQTSLEPLFCCHGRKSKSVNSTERSFICVPIIINKEVVGALGAEISFDKDRNYERSSKFLGIVASMVAQAIELNRLVENERSHLLNENRQLHAKLCERYDFSNIIGNSGSMRQVYEQIAQVAGTNTTVLIRGESGTGKELIARTIHYNSPRAKKAFISVCCAALPDTLIESELFGFERGAFTGAHAAKKGRFELAESGSLLLDEIGELNLPTQVKLLRVVENKQFERLGSTVSLKADVRLIAATNKDLEKAMAAGTFREDLYYRLNVFSIFVPPLRERKGDVMLLADHFLQKFTEEHGKCINRISAPAIDLITSYHWPGNVRELENAIERAVLMCNDKVIRGHHLPPTLQALEACKFSTNHSLSEMVAVYEKDMIRDALKATRGNHARAARLLNTTERIFNYKIKKYGIELSPFSA
jgi:Nif-specific regulatory protein